MNQNQNLHSLTQLTEFARDFENEPNTLFGRFVSKIQHAYNQSYNVVNDMSSGNNNVQQQQQSVSLAETNEPIFYTETKNNNNDNNNVTLLSNNSISLSENSFKGNSLDNCNNTITTVDDEMCSIPLEKNDGRSMLNVLIRIRNLIAYKSNDLRNYKDTDLQQFWMPDSKAKECYDCAQRFSTFRRKHHCRLCGQIFCSKCCNQVVSGKIILCSGDLKVCNYCSKIVLSYLRSPNITKELNLDLQALQQDLSSKLDTNVDHEPTCDINLPQPQGERKISVGYQEERFVVHQPHLTMDDRKNILQQSNSLITLYEEMRNILPPQNNGSDLINYLNSNQKSRNKAQAKAILNAMWEGGFIEPVIHDAEHLGFNENAPFKFCRELSRCNPESGESLNTNLYDKSESYFKQYGCENQPQPPQSIDVNTTKLLLNHGQEIDNSIHFTASKLLESYCDHEEQLIHQMLTTYQLDLVWAKILNPLCCRVANDFKPEYCTNELMDIRNFVNFKKVPGGKPIECTFVGGVVFSKNVAHKDMAARIEQPSILLLQCPIVYERIEGKFVSISTVLLQEKEYLRNVCARIMSFKPNIILVHKNVAGIAQDILRRHGITLVLDVKLSVMDRLARTLQCDILTSIESNISQPKLGKCDAFYTRSFNNGSGGVKTLMYFEKLTSPRGYTCLLRGGLMNELAKVKTVASFLIYARYNWRLEMSFLLDSYTEALSPKLPIFASKDTTPDHNCKNGDNLLNNDITKNVKDNETQRITQNNKILSSKRKSEEKILKAVTDVSDDFTDPLRAVQLNDPMNDQKSLNLELAVELRYDNRFRSALSSTLLSVSPFLTFPLPFLESEQGRKSPLRHLFPSELYYSKSWSNPTIMISSSTNYNNESDDDFDTLTTIDEEIELNPLHPFFQLKITENPCESREVQTLLAEFRASGGRFPKRPKLFKASKCNKNLAIGKYQNPQKISEAIIYKDVLNIENHQRLPVLFCSFYHNQKGGTSSFCAPPTLLNMKFYGQHDIMLGQFLQRYCFRWTNCTVCNLPMMGHMRRYVHSMGCVEVFLCEDHTTTTSNNIYFTAWCNICQDITPTVPISEHTKCLSLAKYLELRFHGHVYKKRQLSNNDKSLKSSCSSTINCQHSLHRDYIHQFSYHGVAAKFQYTPIETWEISLPSLTLNLHPPTTFSRYDILEELKIFSMRGHEIYTRIHERIADLASEDDNTPLITNLKATLSKDQFLFKQHIEIVQTLLIEEKVSCYDITDALMMSKRILAESTEWWEPRLQEIIAAQKNLDKQSTDCIIQQYIDAGTICTEDLQPDFSIEHELPSCNNDHQSLIKSDTNESSGKIEIPISQSVSFIHDKNIGENQFNAPSAITSTNTPLISSSDKKTIKKMLNHLLPSTNPVNLLQTPFSNYEHYTLPVGAFPMVVHDQDISSIIAYSLTCIEYKRLLNNFSSQCAYNSHVNSDSVSISSTSTTGNFNSSPHCKRKSQENVHYFENDDSNYGGEDERVKTTKSINTYVEVTFSDNSSQYTCKIYFAQEFDQMRAKTLNPPKLDKMWYQEVEKSKKREQLKVTQSKTGTGTEMELIHKTNRADFTENYNESKYLKGTNNDDVAQPMDIIEECRIYFARSLCKSEQWEAKGGKSGSKFCKTSDDRFVLKEMSKNDVNIFENFAPNYFDYINKCQQQNQPTLLAKIFGVFKVTVKRKDSSSSIEKSLLVMENLFYERHISSKFDLKGSERNRLVDPINDQLSGDIVLLDENLVRMSWSKPLYMLTHSKVILKDAINRDACFLEKNRVMDYSLLVGLDEKNGFLVLGIIDYIRTFTFDKKVESFVKIQTGILGGMSKLPTIIPPQHYRQRFYDAMDRYFYAVPDRWESLSKV